MSYFIQLRQRIKATETTKKTTNAMRLISMSTHMHLRQLENALNRYKSEIERLLLDVASAHKNTRAETSKINQVSFTGKDLLVAVGSQKGLCGSFNINLATFFKEHIAPRIVQNYDIMVIGRQMKETLRHKEIKPLFSYDIFAPHLIEPISQDLAHYVLSSSYKSVIFYYTHPKGFFTHTLEQLVLTKEMFQTKEISTQQLNATVQEQSYQETFNALGMLSLKSRIQALLLDSLMAESAARFLSMDAATRNADELIADMNLNYNKLRQAAITRELTDLVGSYTLIRS